MTVLGLDIGTNYTKATKDGKEVILFPSLVVYGEEKDWSLKGETRDVYIGEEAAAIAANMENVEVLRPLHEGRLIHQSYIEIAKYVFSKLGKADIIATGLPVKSSKKERDEVATALKRSLASDVLLFPQPVGSLAYLGYDTGVCVDIGFGTTDLVVIASMEYLKGDTMLVGVDKIYENLEISVRNKAGISITPEEMAKLLLDKEYQVGRIRGGKKVVITHSEIMEEYSEIITGWADRIANRVKMLLEGLSTSLVDKIVLTGGGSALPGVYEEFSRQFEDIGSIEVPDDPLTANARGYYILAKLFAESSGVEAGEEEGGEESAESAGEPVKKGEKVKEEGKKSRKK